MSYLFSKEQQNFIYSVESCMDKSFYFYQSNNYFKISTNHFYITHLKSTIKHIYFPRNNRTLSSIQSTVWIHLPASMSLLSLSTYLTTTLMSYIFSKEQQNCIQILEPCMDKSIRIYKFNNSFKIWTNYLYVTHLKSTSYKLCHIYFTRNDSILSSFKSHAWINLFTSMNLLSLFTYFSRNDKCDLPISNLFSSFSWKSNNCIHKF